MSEQKQQPTTAYVASGQFGDFDAFAESVRDWNLDFRQLDRGRFEADLTYVVTPEAILGECKLSRKVEQCGAPPHGFRTFAIPADGGLDLNWRGRQVDSGNLMVFPRGGDLDGVSRPGFHIFAFSVSETVLAEAAARRGLHSAGELLPADDMVAWTPGEAFRLRELAARLSRSAVADPGLLDRRPFRESLAGELVDGVLDALTAADDTAGRPMARARTGALKKALEIIADRADEPVTVAEVERLSGASGRTLRYAFEEAYGMSPKQYLQAYRLDRVHRQLRQAPAAAATVSDAANDWGFWHMGQFARDYRQMFGELPSETLARSA